MYALSKNAYLKLYLHAAKYPHRPVNGLLLSSPPTPGSNDVTITDAIPLLHHHTTLSPMMELGLDLANIHAKETGRVVVGFYQASEGSTQRLDAVGEKVAGRIKEGFKDAIAVVIDGVKLGSGDAIVVCPSFVPFSFSLILRRPSTNQATPPGSH